MLKNFHIFGGKSGFGQYLSNKFSQKYNVFIHGKPTFDLVNETSLHELGSYLSKANPNVFVLNSFFRSTDFSKFYLQQKAFNILWQYLKNIDCHFVVISSAATWFNHNVSNDLLHYRKSKQQLSETVLNLGFLDTSDSSRKAKIILFEPATMENRKQIAIERKTPLLSFNDAYKMIDFSIEMNLPYIRIGAQGSNVY